MSEGSIPTEASADATRCASERGSVLIVDDHPLYRDALVQLMRTLVDASKVLAASSMEQALRVAAGVKDLQLVLLDVGLPGVNGVEAVTTARRAFPSAVLLVVSASDNRRDVNAALGAGARLFVSKTVSTEILADIAHAAMSGELPAQPAWILPDGEATYVDASQPTLTPRQRQILQLLSSGYANKEICLRLGLAEVTVKMHVSAIFRALGVTNRTQAVMVARRNALLEADSSSSP